MFQLATIRRFLWVIPIIMGLVFVAAGAYMISEGRAAKNDVRAELVAEQVTTSKDATIPNTLVDDVATARAQESVITEHTRGRWGPYSQMDREDPNRATYLNGVTLRTALNLAVMGFKVSDLVIGVGAFIVAIGLTNALLLAPVLFWLRQPETAPEPRAARKPVAPPTHLPAPTGGS